MGLIIIFHLETSIQWTGNRIFSLNRASSSALKTDNLDKDLVAKIEELSVERAE